MHAHELPRLGGVDKREGGIDDAPWAGYSRNVVFYCVGNVPCLVRSQEREFLKPKQIEGTFRAGSAVRDVPPDERVSADR